MVDFRNSMFFQVSHFASQNWEWFQLCDIFLFIYLFFLLQKKNNTHNPPKSFLYKKKLIFLNWRIFRRTKNIFWAYCMYLIVCVCMYGLLKKTYFVHYKSLMFYLWLGNIKMMGKSISDRKGQTRSNYHIILIFFSFAFSLSFQISWMLIMFVFKIRLLWYQFCCRFDYITPLLQNFFHLSIYGKLKKNVKRYLFARSDCIRQFLRIFRRKQTMKYILKAQSIFFQLSS